MNILFATGGVSGGDSPQLEFESTPWTDPSYYREISPITYADAIRTPLLIQHSEKDIRTTIAQAEALFTVLRSYHRPVRLLRVPEETHQADPFGDTIRPVENLRIVEGWFRHFLVDGKRGMPPLPKVRGGRCRRGTRADRGVSSPSREQPSRPNSATRERANELIRAWDGRPGPLGSLLGRVTAVDQVGVEERFNCSSAGRSRRRRRCGRSTWRSR